MNSAVRPRGMKRGAWLAVQVTLGCPPACPRRCRVSDLTASVVVAEIGADMPRFPAAGLLISWAGLRPRSDVSAGKRRSSRVRKGHAAEP